MPNDDDGWGEVGRKLDLIARLLAYLVAAEHDNLKDRVVTLNALGLSPAEIARVCNTTANTVTVRLAEAKKKSSREQPTSTRKAPRKG